MTVHELNRCTFSGLRHVLNPLVLTGVTVEVGRNVVIARSDKGYYGFRLQEDDQTITVLDRHGAILDVLILLAGWPYRAGRRLRASLTGHALALVTALAAV